MLTTKPKGMVRENLVVTNGGARRIRMLNVRHKRRNKSVTRQTQSEPEVTVYLAHKRWNLLVLSINIKTASILLLMGSVTYSTGGSNPTILFKLKYYKYISLTVLELSEYTYRSAQVHSKV